MSLPGAKRKGLVGADEAFRKWAFPPTRIFHR